jgi:hypothetical protein
MWPVFYINNLIVILAKAGIHKDREILPYYEKPSNFSVQKIS